MCDNLNKLLKFTLKNASNPNKRERNTSGDKGQKKSKIQSKLMVTIASINPMSRKNIEYSSL
jgi:hypothetical protein